MMRLLAVAVALAASSGVANAACKLPAPTPMEKSAKEVDGTVHRKGEDRYIILRIRDPETRALYYFRVRLDPKDKCRVDAGARLLEEPKLAPPSTASSF